VEWIVFIPAAILAVGGAIGVITARQPVHSAVALLVVLVALAVTYVLLAAQFIAALQVIIYAGAIVVLFLFVIMLLQFRSAEGPTTKLPRQNAIALAFAACYLAVLLSAVVSAAGPLSMVPEGFGTAENVAGVLYTTYLLPFELAAIILLIGIVAAVVLGQRQPSGGVGR
jgi:NADH-quinone oxidoreductase subunit J